MSTADMQTAVLVLGVRTAYGWYGRLPCCPSRAAAARTA
jgi:hypothetical protein